MRDITRYIIKGLRYSDSLKSVVGDRIYPIVAPAGIDSYPFVTYQHSETRNVEHKDYDSYDVTLTLNVVGHEYITTEQLADDCYKSLSDYHLSEACYEEYGDEFDDLELARQDMKYVDEIGCFVGTLTITFTYNIFD